MPRGRHALVGAAAAAAAAALLPSAAAGPTLQFDVVVYGATPAGIAAAITAANGTGLRVALLEPTPYVGGMAGPGGIGLRDIHFVDASGYNDTRTVLARWLELNRQHYGASGPVWQPDQYVGQAHWAALLGDPAYNLTVALSTGVAEGPRGTGVVMDGAAITAVRTVSTAPGGDPANVTTWQAAAFIDASYEADVAAGAGVSLTYGRESAAQYNESLGGVTKPGSFTQFQYPVDPFWPDGSLIPGVDAADSMPPYGSADDRVMPYSYRLCVINTADRVPFPPPAGYNASDFEVLIRYAQSLADASHPDGVPFQSLVATYDYNGYPAGAGRPMRYDLCEVGTSAVSTDEPTALYGSYIVGDRAARAQVVERVKYFVLGFTYTLATHPRVPNATRASAAGWGLCPDAWPDNGNVPPMMYVREGYRLVGDFVSTQNNLVKGVCRADSIGLGSWTIDTHIMRRFVGTIDGKTSAVNEGEIGFTPLPGNGSTYDLPYSLLTPKRSEATNLLVPVCPSATHVAFSSVRVEPTFMQLGTASGVAAALAVKGGMAVQDIPRLALLKAVTEAGQCVHWPNCYAYDECTTEAD